MRRSSLPAKLSSELFHVYYFKKGNYATFLVQLGIIFALVRFFGKLKLHSLLRAHSILILSEKLTRANKFQIELEVV